jgi:hypothetical protein
LQFLAVLGEKKHKNREKRFDEIETLIKAGIIN